LTATLEGQWWVVVAIWAVAMVGTSGLASWAWGPSNALRWIAGTAVFSVGILAYTWWHRDENRRGPGSPRLEVFGPGNALTLTRGLALAMAGGFLLAPEPEGAIRWAPAILYTGAIVADLFDGVLARRANFSTLLGARLDIELDGLGVLIALLLAVHLEQLPAWFIPMGFARPLFSVGVWWRGRQRLSACELPASRHRKLLAGIQMGFLSAALWPVLGRDALTVVGVCVLFPTLVGFARDWLVVSGRLDSTSASYAQLHRSADRILAERLPLALRLLAVLAIAWLWLRDPLSGSWALTLVTTLGALGIVAGFLGRLNAIALIIAVGIHAAMDGPSPVSATVLAGAALVLVFGTGPLSLWKPEEPYVLAKVEAEA
jgi:CDP-diacylglycerol--glycerol-3-phosphate 3-phosphatidyltransferase